MGDSIFERQSEALMTEAVNVNFPSHEENLDDVGCNADLNKARFKVVVIMSDYNKQQATDPHCFQPLSLD